MNILISIVSDQTIPNIQFIKEKFSEVDRFAFISTKSMEERGCCQWILDCLELPEDKVLDPVIVDPFSFDDIESKLNSIVEDENHYIINLTGGTKVTMIFVYDYFKNQDAEMYYLPGDGSFLKIHPGRKKTQTKLQISIGLEEYLKAFGFSIINKSEPILSFEENKKLLNFFLNKFNHDVHSSVLEQLRLEHRGKKISNINTIQGLHELLQEIGVNWECHGELNKYEVKTLTGEWLEEYLYQFIIQNFKIRLDTIGLGLHVEKNGAPNEFDVLLMKNNRLYLFECKTSIFKDSERKEHFFGETVYKSDSLRHNFGLFTNTVIVTLSDLSIDKFKSHRERAKVGHVKVLDRNNFTDDLKKALDKI